MSLKHDDGEINRLRILRDWNTEEKPEERHNVSSQKRNGAMRALRQSFPQRNGGERIC